MDIRSTKFSKTIALESFRQLSCDIDFFTYYNIAGASAGAKKIFFSKFFFPLNFDESVLATFLGCQKRQKSAIWPPRKVRLFMSPPEKSGNFRGFFVFFVSVMPFGRLLRPGWSV